VVNCDSITWLEFPNTLLSTSDIIQNLLSFFVYTYRSVRVHVHNIYWHFPRWWYFFVIWTCICFFFFPFICFKRSVILCINFFNWYRFPNKLLHKCLFKFLLKVWFSFYFNWFSNIHRQNLRRNNRHFQYILTFDCDFSSILDEISTIFTSFRIRCHR